MRITITEVTSTSTTLEAFPGAAALGPGDPIDVGLEVGGGGFGTVHRCDGVGSHRAPGIVIKHHTPNGAVAPEDNAAVLRALHHAIDARWASSAATLRALLPAVPFWVGRARWGGDVVTVSLARDLGVEGMTEFADVLGDLGALRSWLGLDLAERLGAAHEFVSGHAFVEELDVVHADINPENVFIDPGGGRATLIDWDSGTLPGAPNKDPLAWGKPDDFIAPEAKRTGVLDVSSIGLLTDRWAVGCMVHYLLFGVGPLFFLSTLSEQDITRYLADHTWPDIDRSSPLFNTPNRGFYSRYLQDLAEVPPAVVDLFRRFVADGTAFPASRPTAAAWRDALASVATPPEFEWVTLSSEVTAGSLPVRVAWAAPGASDVFVDGDGPHPPTGCADVTPRQTGPISLEAVNPFGSTVHLSPEVTVLASPPRPVLDLTAPLFAVPTLTLEVGLSTDAIRPARVPERLFDRLRLRRDAVGQRNVRSRILGRPLADRWPSRPSGRPRPHRRRLGRPSMAWRARTPPRTRVPRRPRLGS